MTEFLKEPWIGLIAAPILGVAILAGLIKLSARGGTGFDPKRTLPGAAVGVVFAWISALVLGSPEFPPIAGSESIVTLTAALLLVGLLIDYFLPIQNLNFRLWETIIVIVTGIAFIAWLRAGLDLWTVILLLSWGLVAFRLLKVGAQNSIGTASASAMMIMAALGMAGVSYIAGLPADRDIAIGLAAALFGFFTWNWPRSKFVFGFSLLLAGGGAIIILAVRLLEQSTAFIPALILIGFVFFADSAIQRISLLSNIRRPEAIPLLIALISVLPLLLAVLVAFIGVEYLAS